MKLEFSIEDATVMFLEAGISFFFFGKYALKCLTDQLIKILDFGTV